MGLLDDAIREHLELKRVHGAEAGELSRLEEEAFSPPSRPGDPDFGPEPGAPPTGEEAGGEPINESDGEDLAPAEDITGAELGRVEHASLDDTIPHPVTDDEPAVSAEATAVPEASASLPPEPPESAIFSVEDELEIDLDLEIDDEIDLDAPPTPAPAAATSEEDDDFLADADFGSAFDPEPSAPVDPAPVPRVRVDEPLDTGEQPAPLIPEDESSEDEADEPIEAESAEEDDGAKEEVAGEDDDDEDILEETPDFLKEAPDGESLWFEQGKPKDFDFGEDD